MTRRTLPGSIPGLIRRCSPVALDNGARDGIVVALAPYGLRVSVGRSEVMHEPRHVHLDLDDETGQDHAMRWIASRMGWAVLAEELRHGGDAVDALVRAVTRIERETA